MIDKVKTLHTLEKAICTLDEMRQSKQVNQDEVMDALRDLRACRAEYLKEVGEHSGALKDVHLYISLQEKFQADREIYRKEIPVLDIALASAASAETRDKIKADRAADMLKNKPAHEVVALNAEELAAQAVKNKEALAIADAHKNKVMGAL